MKRFIITDNNYLYDCNFYGIDSMGYGETQRSIQYNEKNKNYYFHYWNSALNEFGENPVSEIRINVVEAYDDIEEVKKHCIIEEEPYEVPYDIPELGYIEPIRAINKTKLSKIQDQDMYLLWFKKEIENCEIALGIEDLENTFKRIQDYHEHIVRIETLKEEIKTYKRCLIQYVSDKYKNKKGNKKEF